MKSNFTDALILEYVYHNDGWHSYDNPNGYRAVDCKNLTNDEVEAIIKADHSNMLINGSSIINEPDSINLPIAKIKVNSETLWNYLYYRGGTAEKPIKHAFRTILDVDILRNNVYRARKFFMQAVKIEDTVSIIKKENDNIYLCNLVWYTASGDMHKSWVWLPAKFIEVISSASDTTME